VANGTGVFTPWFPIYVDKNLALSLELYKGIGIPQETIDTISGSLDQIQYMLVRILPALAAASTLFVAWTNLIAARPIMQRRGLSFPGFRSPQPLAGAESLDLGGHRLWPDHAGARTDIRLIGVNGLLVLLTIYFIQGIALFRFFREKECTAGRSGVALPMIAFQQMFLLIVICIGLFDMWINFRKIDTNTNEPDLPL
jgi:hypothetical protein